MSSNYAYQIEDGQSNLYIAMSTRHDAIGLATILDNASEHKHTISVEKHHAENELGSLVPMDEQARDRERQETKA